MNPFLYPPQPGSIYAPPGMLPPGMVVTGPPMIINAPPQPLGMGIMTAPPMVVTTATPVTITVSKPFELVSGVHLKNIYNNIKYS